MNGKRFGIGVLAAVVTVALAASFAEAAEKMQYRLKLQKGKKYYLRMITETKTSYTLMGRERPMEEVIGFGYNFDVNDIDMNGNAWVTCTFDWIKLNYKGPGGQVVYDSTQLFAPVAPAAKRLAMLLGARFQIITTPLGNVKQVTGLQRMFKKIEKNIKKRRQESFMLESLKEQFTEKTIKQIFESHLAVYPETAVGVGDSWRKTVVAPQGQPIIVENIWTVKERKNGIAIIENNSNIKSDPNVKPVKGDTTKTSRTLSGKKHGLMEVEELTGLIRDSSLNLEMTGEIKVETTGEETSEKIIPMKVQSVVTFQMTERKKEEEQEKEVVQ
jgi:hypothetical protein